MAPRAKSDVAQTTLGNGGAIDLASPFGRMLTDMARIATVESEDATFTGDALAAIYNAKTEDDIWESDMTGPINAKVLAGCELALYDLSVKYSRNRRDDEEELKTPWVAPDGKRMYVLVTAARISNAGHKRLINLPEVGEQFQFNTSAQYLTAKLFTFHTRGFFGNGKTMNAAIQGTDLGDNRAVLKLVRVPERAVQSTVQRDDRYPVSESGERVPF